MKLKAFAVIDTNVLVSGLISKGPPSEVIKLVNSQNIIPLFDERMLSEYADVLNRKDKFNISSNDVYDTLYQIVDNGILVNDVEKTKIELRDRKDIPFFEVKESSEEFSPYLVTGNLSDFPQSSTTIEPAVMLATMSNLEFWATKGLRDDIDYDKIVDDYKNAQLATSKYTSGKELIDDIFDQEAKTINPSSKILKLGAIAFDNTFAPKDSSLSSIDPNTPEPK